MLLQSKKIFLIDSLGAAISAFLLGVVLIRFESAFGMPAKILYFLSATACFFAIYASMSYFLTRGNWKSHLKFISLANLIYCFITLVLLIYFNKILTPWGLLYFLAEIAVIMTLAIFEIKTAFK